LTGKASPYEIDWQFTFFDDHYDQLKEIKDKYDPVGLFVVHEGVGWDFTTLTCK
jgi:Berberine and berberine like